MNALFDAINDCAEPVAILILATSIDGDVTVTESDTESARASDEVSVLVNESVFTSVAMSYRLSVDLLSRQKEFNICNVFSELGQ